MMVFFSGTTTFAATKGLSSKNFTDLLGVTNAGWVTVRTTLNGTLTYSDSSTKRTFIRENYAMHATSANDRQITNQLNISMGYMTLSAGGTEHTCYNAAGNYPYYSDPDWIKSISRVSKTKAVGKLNGGSWAKVSYLISGCINPTSGTAKWSGIAK